MKGNRTEPPNRAEGRRERWMERAQTGDQEAYAALLEDLGPELRAFLRRRIRDSHEVEDLLQEVLLSMHRARHTFDPTRAFEPWLYAIARNATVDWFRRSRLRARREILAGDDSTPEVAGDDAHEIPPERVLASLPEGQRRALEMVKLEGLTIEQAAARAGVSPGTLRVRIHRGYRALRALLTGR